MISQSFQQNIPLEIPEILVHKVLQNPLQFQTTSIDGKPFLNPLEFSLLRKQNLTLNYQAQRNSFTYNKFRTAGSQAVHPQMFFHSNQHQNNLNIKRNSQHLNEFPTDYLEKKVKTENFGFHTVSGKKEGALSDVSTIYSGSPLTNDPDSLRQEPYAEISEITFDKEVKDQDQQSILNKPKKFISPNMTKKLKNLKFKVKSHSKNENQEKSVSREEILKQDPLLLIYFYEKHLEFSKTKDFDPKTLKKLQD